MDLLHQAIDGFGPIGVSPRLKEQAVEHLRRWLTMAEFAAYRPQLEWLITSGQWAGLLDRFYQILPFGTGGRRGAVGIGPNRMNLWTLGASVQGHCEYLRERFPSVETLQVVLAYDIRQFEDQRRCYNPDLPNPVLHLSSKTFAHHAAQVYAANGIRAHVPATKDEGGRMKDEKKGTDSSFILPPSSFMATPELSFIIRKLGTHGGLNISASHNPPDDNGGKFYDERGGQPVPPEDQIMADLVDQVTAIKVLPWTDALHAGRVRFLDSQLHQSYIDLCRKQSLIGRMKDEGGRMKKNENLADSSFILHPSSFKVVFTPLHGVGSMTAMEVLQQQGFVVVPVMEQMEPNGQFPNVTQTPNPEVPVSMDRAKALAESIHADLVLATDPDADRLGAMVPDQAGHFQFLNGNTIASLLTHFKLSKLAEGGIMPANPIVVKTLLTTSLITRIARSFQAQVVENLLVGFKYIAEVLWQLEQNGCYEDVKGTPQDFVLGCEESHGILVTPHLRDKDAGGAALLLAELALDQKRQGSSVLEYLERLWRQFGYFSSRLGSIVMPGIEGKQTMARMLNLLRQSPPREIAGLQVTKFDDLLDETGWMGPYKGATDRAARNFLIFYFGDSARVALRPSGTEPKAKVYIETCSPPRITGTTDADWSRSCTEIDKLAERLERDFTQLATGLVKGKATVKATV